MMGVKSISAFPDRKDLSLLLSGNACGVSTEARLQVNGC